MTSKERAELKGLAMTMDPIINIGKSSLTPELTDAVSEALEKRELIKIGVLKNCIDDPRSIAEVLAERTKSEVVQVIGKKIVLYKKNLKKAANKAKEDAKSKSSAKTNTKATNSKTVAKSGKKYSNKR